MMSNEYWTNYKNFVDETFQRFDEFTTPSLLFGLTSSSGHIFDSTMKEIMTKDSYKEERIKAIGEVFWFIAAMEVQFGLPNSLYTSYIGTPMEMNGNHDFELMVIHRDFIGFLSFLSGSINDRDLDDIQFNLNKLVNSVFEVCIYYSINPLDALNDSFSRNQDKSKSNGNEYEEDFKKSSEEFKKISRKQIVIDIKTDKRFSNPFRCVILKAFSKELIFETGDLITDFFLATDYLYTKYTSKSYSINYGPELRKYLEEVETQIYPGFIVKDRLVGIHEVLSQNEDGILRVGKEARPILMHDNLEKFTDLLDHVVDIQRQVQVDNK